MAQCDESWSGRLEACRLRNHWDHTDLDLGRRLQTKPGMPQCQKLNEILETVLESVSASLKAPVAKTDVELDLRSQYIRTREV